MGRFLEIEKKQQTDHRRISEYFPNSGDKNGIYKGKGRAFCLPRRFSEENLYREIRSASIAYFAINGIHWHDGSRCKPSNHLCDSQVCCVNFLYPFSQNPMALAQLMRPVFGQIQNILPMEPEFADNFMAFEWIGMENYLRERAHTRGANCTSTDAAFMFERDNGEKHIVLIEWKYTESYAENNKADSSGGKTRIKTYKGFFEDDNSPFKKDLVAYEELFYEPFYQLMRQQMLAAEMEKARELNADAVTLLHISPMANTDFKRITSPRLRDSFPGSTAVELWKKLLSRPEKFDSISTEKLFRDFPVDKFPGLQDWWRFIQIRYSWIND